MTSFGNSFENHTHPNPEDTPMYSLLTAKIVTIFVGAERQKFVVHKDLLCARSDYFKAAFNGNFKEAGGELYLLDEDIAAFELFITWVYSGMLLSYITTAENVATYFALLALSEKFLVERLSNQAVDEIRGYYWRTRDLMPAEHVLYICENTSNPRLHHAMIHYAAHQLLEQDRDSFSSGYREILARGGEHAVLLFENLLNSTKFHSRATCGVMNIEHRCAYHTHNITPKCIGPKISYDRLNGPKFLAGSKHLDYIRQDLIDRMNDIDRRIPDLDDAGPLGNSFTDRVRRIDRLIAEPETGALGTGFDAWYGSANRTG